MNVETIKQDYYSGILRKDICKKNQITENQLTYLIRKNNWKTRNRKGNKGNKGNKNAHPPLENQNAVVTGAYAKLRQKSFTEEELALFNEPLPDKKQILEDEIITLEIRKNRMLAKIKDLQEKKKELTVMQMSKYGTTTSTQAENTQNLINRIEEGLTRVQDAKRKAVDSLHKICMEDEAKENQEELDKLDEILKNMGGVI